MNIIYTQTYIYTHPHTYIYCLIMLIRTRYAPFTVVFPSLSLVQRTLRPQDMVNCNL